MKIKAAGQMPCGFYSYQFTDGKGSCAGAAVAVRQEDCAKMLRLRVKEENRRCTARFGKSVEIGWTYLEALAARMASIIIGTTLNRSPQMP